MKKITNYNSKRDDLNRECLKCKKEIMVKWVPQHQKYSDKNHWGYWTEKEKDQNRYICDGCLAKLYYRNKPLYLELISSPKKKATLSHYFNRGALKSSLSEIKSSILEAY